MHTGYILALLGLPVLLLNLWGFRHAYRQVRRTIPGFPRPSAVEPPRQYLVGTPRPHGSPRLAPISGRPCVAWRLTVAWRHRFVNTVLRQHDRYSDADFTLDCGDAEVHVRLLDGKKSFLPAQAFPNASPPWVMPRQQSPKLDFVVRILEDEAILPEFHGLANEQAARAEQAALAERSRYTPHQREKDAAVDVTETILDIEHEWVCEGQPDPAGSGMNISSSRQTLETLDTFAPTKLALATTLDDARRKAIWNELWPIAFFDVLLLTPILVGIILAFI
jgi:hypothetical protein